MSYLSLSLNSGTLAQSTRMGPAHSRAKLLVPILVALLPFAEESETELWKLISQNIILALQSRNPAIRNFKNPAAGGRFTRCDLRQGHTVYLPSYLVR
jgi:hypothetical protein